ncbi:MAG: hypothetical protein IJR94_06970 [Synergistaceae bacterium]|nr:hypothetical protein [Synergistaceae bacterium]
MKKLKIFLACILFIILSAPARAANFQEALVSADALLKKNNFLLDEEIHQIYEREQTPDALIKLSAQQQQELVENLRRFKNLNASRSLEYGRDIQDPLVRSLYQDRVFNNLMLRTNTELAKRYGIMRGDIFNVELHFSFSNNNGNFLWK